MKKEYIVSFNGVWYHFYNKPSIGFCVSEKKDIRFINEKILLKDAYCDFSVSTNDKGIYVVCQDIFGSIVFFMFDGRNWNSKIILEAKDKKPEYKNLTLIPMGEFINLFFVISSKGEKILVHQILNGKTSLPNVIDKVSDSNFSVCPHKTSNMTLLYKNESNEYGTKTYKWSKKAFSEFIPLDCGCTLDKPVSFIDDNDCLNIAAYVTFDKFTNIIYIKNDLYSGEINLAAIHLIIGSPDGLCINTENKCLNVSWCEDGLVMSSSFENNKWTKPKKFLKGASCENTLYIISEGSKIFSSFGYKKDEKILLYDSVKTIQNSPVKSFSKDLEKRSDYVKTSIYAKDLAAIRKLLSSQNDIINELSKKISVLEGTDNSDTILENPDDLDRFTASNIAKES